MSAYSYDRRTKTADYSDLAIDALSVLQQLTPQFRNKLKALNKARVRSGLPKLADAERQFEHVVDALQATEYDLTQL